MSTNLALAGATTYAVSGGQITVNEDVGKYRMKGGLVGKMEADDVAVRRLGLQPGHLSVSLSSEDRYGLLG